MSNSTSSAVRRSWVSVVSLEPSAEDAVLVRVTEPDKEVFIAKEGRDLVIRVREAGSEGARVFVRTPLRALSEAVAGACEERDTSLRYSPGRVARLLIPVLRGTEIEVRAGDTRMDVSVWYDGLGPDTGPSLG